MRPADRIERITSLIKITAGGLLKTINILNKPDEIRRFIFDSKRAFHRFVSAELTAGQDGVRIPEVLLVIQGSEVLKGAFRIILKLIHRRLAQCSKLAEHVLVQPHPISIQSAASHSPPNKQTRGSLQANLSPLFPHVR